MHFWIDKRSQQCGFGRSRVAASLSGAGGSGLSFGHPPRRAGGYKSTTSSNSSMPIHRQQQQQQPQQQQQQQQYGHYTQHHVTYSTAGTTTTTVDYHRSNNYGYSANNNNNTPSSGGQHSSSSQQLNNNIALQQQNNAYTNPTSQSYPTAANINNNNSIASSLSGVISGSSWRNARYILPSSTINSNQISLAHHQQPTHHHDMRSYHHPQFGNMSVRHYQQTDIQQPSANIIEPSIHNGGRQTIAVQNYGCSQNASTASMVPHQTTSSMPATDVNRQSQRDFGSSQRSNSVSNLRPANCSTSYSTSSMGPSHHHHQQHATTMHSVESVDNQLLPTHLKCGMCASLVLASVFVAGAKFYFDHQGTGLEVLIFCAFSATFFLAACTVSLCRVPKGLLPHRSTADQRRTACGLSSRGSTLNSVDDIVVSGLHELQERTQTVANNAAAQAGPPPYHIAILLPETKNHDKGITSVEESPPPSYDKILV
uniref:Uncharacterized protein n=1 Tax=Glossina pallidipes TaxID=7398 RepID=A0A1A9ZBX6_GLOPL